MSNFTIYSSIRHLKFSRLIYHTSKQSSASTHACISPAKANRAYPIGLSMARAFNAYCELGEVFNPSSAFLVSERLGHENVSTTQDIYSHLFPSKQSEVSDKLERLYQKDYK